MYTADDINNDLKRFMSTSSGKKILEDNNINSGFIVSDEKILSVVNELKNTIYSAILSAMKNPHFEIGSIKVGNISRHKNGTIGISITFYEWGLKRQSLMGDGGEYTGSGVYDIVGLFTQGYTASRFAYGNWVESASKESRRGTHYASGEDFGEKASHVRSHAVGTMPGLVGAPFISDAIDEFSAKYAWLDVKVTYPKLWGGTK